MTPLTDEIVDRVADLLDRADPRQVSPQDFLAARFDAGLAWLHFPTGCGGRVGDDRLQAPLEAALAAAGAPDPFARNPMGIGMVGPTIAHHGTDEQRSRYLRPMYSGEEVWCQLFSEPSAGLDLASLATRAVRDGDDWLVSGQKVWTSLGHLARYGLLLARTSPDVAKHRGLTCFVVDMRAPGVEVRPLRQLTGDAEFNEVFLEDVCIANDQRVGDVDDGWTVAITTLMNERSAIGGAVAKHAAEPVRQLIEIYQARHPGNPVARDRVVRLWIEAEILRLTDERARHNAEAGKPGPETSVAKLFGCELNQRVTTAAVDLLGADAMVHEAVDADAGEAAMGTASDPLRRFLRARANTIEGGTSEVMRNVLGERVLGLPSEPRADAGQTWSQTRRAQPTKQETT
ncbi:MAG: acyl-CoA dehydrogenase family protein [Acidimicrobiales bacterium]